jgi:tetratricopeptide (TPR) repeat protein
MLAELAVVLLLAGGSPAGDSAGDPAPPADPAMVLGEAFQRSGAFSEAVTEYKRFLFFNPEDPRAGEVRSRLGFCLLAEGRHSEGLAALRLAAAGEQAEGLDRRLDLVRALLEAGKDAEAELELLRLRAFFGEWEGSLPLYLAVLRIDQGRWAEAEEALGQAFPDAELRPLRELLAEARRLRLKSPRAARLLSAFLPGAGQAYAGDVPDGLNAIAVNGGIAVLAAAAAVNGYYPEAVLLVLFPLRRYYTGNIGNAGRLAERRNSTAQEEYRRRIMDTLAGLLAAGQGR